MLGGLTRSMTTMPPNQIGRRSQRSKRYGRCAMDGRGFDDFTRKLGRGASRRSVLKGLAAGLGVAFVGKGPAKALAQQSCETTEDCDNGFTCEANMCVEVVGECKVEGGACTDTEQCCTPLLCEGEVCTVPCVSDDDCEPGFECSSSGVCFLVVHPCGFEGQTCEAQLDCFPNLVCTNNLCVPAVCSDPGEGCALDTDCCPFIGLICISGV